MTKESTKTYLLTIAQVPVALLLLAVAAVELCCTYIEVRLKRLMIQPVADIEGECGTDKENGDTDEIQAFVHLLSQKDDDCIDWVRDVLESYDVREIVGRHPNRKLYAVLKPTREESLQRIEWTLRAWPRDYQAWFIETIGRLVTGYEHMRLPPLYRN